MFLTAFLAFLASLTGGVSDFLGGVISRRTGSLSLVLATQSGGTMLAAAWVIAVAEPLPASSALLAAALSGVALTIALVALFQGMVVGAVSVVAPISATGVAIPVAAGLWAGESLTATETVGMVAAVAGVLLILHGDGAATPEGRKRSGVWLALVAAVGTGVFFWTIASASEQSVAWALLISKAVSVGILSVIFVRGSHRPGLVADRSVGLGIGLAVLFGTASIALYGFASRRGQLAIVAVLASLYPVVPFALAHRLLGERIKLVQHVGVAIVLFGVLLLSLPV